jgi:ATP-dependent DNA helicase RecG
VPGTSFLDLKEDAVRSYYDSRFSGESLAALDDEDELVRQLRGIRLMNGDHLSLTGVLLFAKNPNVLLPSFTINAIWFKGNERDSTEYRDSRRLEGTLQTQFEKAMAFLHKWNSRIQTDSFNENGREEVPSIVFEELLVNARVHRDYAIQDSVKLFIFDNRIEIRSPGCLPNSLTEEALKGIGRDHNPQLESFAYDLMNYRGARSGLRRVRQLIPKLELQNDIEDEEVVVVIPV